MLLFGSPKREGGITTNEAQRRSRPVIELIYPKAKLMRTSIDRGAGAISRRPAAQSLAARQPLHCAVA